MLIAGSPHHLATLDTQDVRGRQREASSIPTFIDLQTSSWDLSYANGVPSEPIWVVTTGVSPFFVRQLRLNLRP